MHGPTDLVHDGYAAKVFSLKVKKISQDFAEDADIDRANSQILCSRSTI